MAQLISDVYICWAWEGKYPYSSGADKALGYAGAMLSPDGLCSPLWSG